MPYKSLLLLLASITLAWSQAHRAIVLGRVTDSSGAVVAGVSVKIVHKETNTAREARTNPEGNYEVPGLFPGVYRVEARQTGFKAGVADDISVASGQRVSVDIRIEVGNVTDSVVVSAAGELLETANADTNTVFRGEALQNMPIGQGHASYALFKAPGVNGTAPGAGGGGDTPPNNRGATGQTQVNGSPMGSTEFTLDGSPNTQRQNGGAAGGGISFNATTDVVQEVRVQTNSFDASIGHTGGATVDVLLKSGTNALHGTGYGFLRNPSWQANSWASNRTGRPRPDFTYRRYGFTAGGPVRIPKTYDGRDRTFFFYGFEKWANQSANPPVTGTVPLPGHLQGDFSGLLALGAQYQLYDPESAVLNAGRIQRTPHAGNRIPQSRLDGSAREMLKLWPAPNITGTPDGRLNFSYYATPNPLDFWNSVLRLDQAFGTAHRFYGRYLRSNAGFPLNSLYGRTDIPNSFTSGRNLDVAASDVWTISPSMVAEFRAAVSRFHWDTRPIGAGVGYDTIGLGSLTRVFDTLTAGLPNVAINDYVTDQAQPGRTGFWNTTPTKWTGEIRSASANFSRLTGNHGLKFGADVRLYIDNRGTADYLNIAFTGEFSRGPFNNSPASPFGQSLADFLQGKYDTSTLIQAVKPANLATHYGIYLQDDWKITKRLTINAGLRWEREGPPTERFNRSVSSFDTRTPSPIQDQARANYAANPIPEIPVGQFNVSGGVRFAGVSGAPRTAYESDNNNFAPRIGLAYRVASQTVIRTGYGIFFIPYGQRFYAAEAGVPGFDTRTVDFSSPDGGASFTNRLANLFSKGLDAPIAASQGLRTNLGQGLAIPTALRRLPNAYNQRWQFEIQRLFGRNYRLQLRYVGNRTVKMPVQQDLAALPVQYLSTLPERDQATINNLTGLVNNPFFGIPGMTGPLAAQRLIPRQTLLSPYPHFTFVRAQTINGWSTYHAFQWEFQKALSHGFAIQSNYTFSKTLEAFDFQNAGDPLPVKAISPGDRPQLWRLIGSYQLPFTKRGWTGRAVNGWQIQIVGYYNSGRPLEWPDVIFRGNIKDIPVSPQTADRMFNIDAGFERLAARQPALRRRTWPQRLASVRDQGTRAWEAALLKDTVIREGVRIQFRAEAYNALNQHQFNVNANTTPQNTAFGTTTQPTVPRAVQIGARVIF